MTPEQITLVQTSWAKVAPIADQAADIFYDRLFERPPSQAPARYSGFARWSRPSPATT